ncbi:hypothetical protein EAH89_17225 [Roseomonas nepalensis]|uniref:Terminase small subunit n=1 Tax=Muricoccus nepalensis TaxID=1854500 RepID=A0A502FV44_9PROT|nr:hypothetical protein [Roseomonas nepalensis]TPG53259.1 hypothetical protein EAH89_17225 [Roseomonas nepalensis]
MSAALAAEAPKRQRRSSPPQLPPAEPQPRILNKRDLCREAGISRTTLDERIARDPHFPVLRRGDGNGDSWEFDAEAALARLADDLPRPDGELSPNQKFMALRVLRMERDMAAEAGGLLVAAEMRVALARGLTGLRRGLTGPLVAKAGETLGLTRDQQRTLRALIEDELRAFVAGLAQTGLPDADE